MNSTKKAMTYIEIKQSNKDYLYIVNYEEDSSIHFKDAFNSIGGTYPGIEIDSYIDTLRGFTRKFPEFIENFGHDFKKEIEKMGFVRREPTEFEVLLYKK